MGFGWSRPQGTKGISRPRKTTAVRSGKDLASARWAIIWRVFEKRARRIGGVRAQFGWWLHPHALGKPRAVGSSCFVQKCMFCCCAQLAWQWKMLLSESYSYDKKKAGTPAISVFYFYKKKQTIFVFEDAVSTRSVDNCHFKLQKWYINRDLVASFLRILKGLVHQFERIVDLSWTQKRDGSSDWPTPIPLYIYG